MKVSKQFEATFLTHGLHGALPNPKNSGVNYQRQYNKTQKGRKADAAIAAS